MNAVPLLVCAQLRCFEHQRGPWKGNPRLGATKRGLKTLGNRAIDRRTSLVRCCTTDERNGLPTEAGTRVQLWRNHSRNGGYGTLSTEGFQDRGLGPGRICIQLHAKPTTALKHYAKYILSENRRYVDPWTRRPSKLTQRRGRSQK